MKKLKSTTDWLLPCISVAAILIIWQVAAMLEIIPSFMLPSPIEVAEALVNDMDNLCYHAGYTLLEALCGMSISIVLSFGFACLMDRFSPLRKALYPLLVVTQTVPSVAIAPLLVVWFGFGLTPKIILIVIVCFFPLAVGFLDGFASADPDEIKLLRSMGATDIQIFRHVKLPHSLPHFFAGLKVSSSYCIVSAVIADWIGGSVGLGVYMERVRKSYAYDKMFAVIILTSALSLLVMAFISYLQKKLMPYMKNNEDK